MKNSRLLLSRNIFTSRKIWLILLVALIVLLFTFPAFTSDYNLELVLNILIFAIFCLGTNILMGYTGLVSFGQGAFYGAGAYACGKIMQVYPNIIFGIVVGVLVAAGLAVVLGWFATRNTAIYFSMITLAFSMMLWAFANRFPFVGRYDGLRDIPRGNFEIPGLFSVNLTATASYYIVVLAICLIAIFICYKITHSNLGLSIQGLRDSESRIGLTGFSVRRGRLLSFVISGAFCGLAGALLAPLNHVVTPGSIYWSNSFNPVIGSLLGGMYNFAGPIVGGAVYYLAKDIIVRYTTDWMLPMGVIAIVLVLGFRKGIVGSLQESALPRLKTLFKRVNG